VLKIRKISVFILYFIIMISCYGCDSIKTSNINDFIECEEFGMGTIIKQRVYGKNARTVADEVTEALNSIEKKLSVNLEGSEIDRLNKNAGKSYVTLSEDTCFVLEKSLYYSRLSDGRFNPMVGPLVKAWGINTDKQRVPEQTEIADILKLVDVNDILLDKKSSRCMLAKEGQLLDLGGIVKGYAGDVAAEIYKRKGIESAYINLGGNVVVVGNKPDGTPWEIGIQDPRDVKGSIIGTVNITDQAVVTSGDYERFFEKDNIRYHHIIDPKTGYPADSGLMSVTVIMDASIDADALSTAAFVLGLDKGMKLIEDIKGAEGIFITTDKKIYVTVGLRNIFNQNEKANGYEYVQKR